mgnify:CR=1 FL=1
MYPLDFFTGKSSGIKITCVYGGVPKYQQARDLRNGVEIVICTPGRMIDFLSSGTTNFRRVTYLVMDEADRMLDMGFINDVKKVLAKVPPKRQTLFFSATMPPEIQALANTILKNPAEVKVTPVSSTVEIIQQSLYYVDKKEKKKLLMHILRDESITRSLVFTRTKHGADKLVKDLQKNNISAAAIHGNKSQNARQRALNDFKDNRIRVLVATDIAARGIDIDDLPHVVNYELPDVPETYVHRIGRTGRAGAEGVAIAFCEAEELDNLKDIQKLIGLKIPVVEDHPYPATEGRPTGPKPEPRKPQRKKRPHGKGHNGSKTRPADKRW